MEQTREAKAAGGTEVVGAAAIGPCAAIPAEHMTFIREVLDRVGDKWSLLLIAVLEPGPLRYTDLQRQVPGISQRMLTLTLRQLQQDGLISRTAYAEVPPRVEYTLTPLGRGLHEIATSLVGWAAAHHDEIRENRARATSAQPSTTARA
ncbi:winged helix-turn-helix transcriptional regulator [Streptomyces sp. NPDC101160]|uniref:winged helix-turn-helix transcriptional regulator n=1 Tax=Streptomyces sp. NPDC101160 TaxID=3366118 RepID=UPI00381478DA